MWCRSCSHARRFLDWTKPNQITAPWEELFWLPLPHMLDFAVAAKTELQTGVETQVNTMKFWGKATKNPWAPKGANSLNFPPKKIKSEPWWCTSKAMGSLHSCTVETEMKSPRRHPGTICGGQTEDPYSDSSFHSTNRGKKHIRHLNSLPPAKNCSLVLALPGGSTHWVWQWSWFYAPKLNTTW